MPTPILPNVTLAEGPGIAAIGSVLYLQTLQTPPTFAAVGNLGNMKWGFKLKTADVTNQGTVWMQSIPTLRDGGTITGDLFFMPLSPGADAAGQIEGHSFVDGLGFIATNADVRQWKLVWPDGSGMFFSAYITDFPIDMAVEKALTCAITLTVTGPPTFFAADVTGVTPQTITFAAIPAKSIATDSPLTLVATSTSTLAVAFTVTGPATFATPTTLTLNGTGLVTVTAHQAGNGIFAAAPPVVRTFDVAA